MSARAPARMRAAQRMLASRQRPSASVARSVARHGEGSIRCQRIDMHAEAESPSDVTDAF